MVCSFSSQFFSPVVKKKSMSYFVKKLYVYIYFQQRIPSTYKDKKILPILSNDMHFFPHYKS